jgi:hypothetical protein
MIRSDEIGSCFSFLPFARSSAEPVPTSADRAWKQKTGRARAPLAKARGESPLMHETKDPRRNAFAEPPAPLVSPRASLACRIAIAA